MDHIELLKFVSLGLDYAVLAFKIAVAGLWHFKEHPEIFLPIYIWLVYGSVSGISSIESDFEYLADWKQLRKMSIGHMFIGLALPLIPIVCVFVFFATIYATIASVVTTSGPFLFLKWRPFDFNDE
jgi:hypothetical protein